MSRKVAYIVQTGKRIAPLDDPVGEVLIKHKPLAEHQREALAELGFEVQYISGRDELPRNSDSCLLLDDDIYFNAATIHEFLRVSRDTPASTQCAIAKETAFAKVFTALQDPQSPEWARFPLFNLKNGDLSRCEVKVIDIKEHRMPFYVPPHMKSASWDTVVPLTAAPLMQISHAIDIIHVNLAALNVRFAKMLSSPVSKLLAALRAGSRQSARVLATMNKIGRNCDIHPTAYLEGAEIGSNVQIGANAVIRMSSIGDGCEIGECSVVKHAVIGPGSVLYGELGVSFIVCYPETFLIHGPYSFSLFGRESAMFATILDDYRLDGNPIRLQMGDGKLVVHPQSFIGCFIGHRTRVAGGSILSPGRSLPNDLLIFPSPGAVLTRLPGDLPKGVPLFIHDGTLMEGSDPRLKPEQTSQHEQQERPDVDRAWATLSQGNLNTRDRL